jgi:hypothetical protein
VEALNGHEQLLAQNEGREPKTRKYTKNQALINAVCQADVISTYLYGYIPALMRRGLTPQRITTNPPEANKLAGVYVEQMAEKPSFWVMAEMARQVGEGYPEEVRSHFFENYRKEGFTPEQLAEAGIEEIAALSQT